MRARDLNVIIVRWNETTAQIRLGNGWTTDYANYLRIPDLPSPCNLRFELGLRLGCILPKS